MGACELKFDERVRMLQDDIVLKHDVLMREYTTLRVGGPADYFVDVQSEAQAVSLLQAAQEAGMPVLVIGNGSNVLVRDGGFRGMVLHMGKLLSGISVEGTTLVAEAGASLAILARTAAEHDLAGLEFAGGIPGTVGGAVYMNAGAYGGEMAKVVETVRVLTSTGMQCWTNAQMHFAYRHSRAMAEGAWVLGATFALQPGARDEIEREMKETNARRRDKQPLEYPSAGSFFKRPEGYFAGALIEGAGLKGTQMGGARVSDKHAGFLINTGDATAADFLQLMRHIQATIRAKDGVMLEPEVRIVGVEG